MKHLCIILLSFFVVLAAKGQHEEPWEEVWQALADEEDYEEEDCQENHEQLSFLAAHPLELNSVTREDLEQLPFLTESQINDLLDYLSRYGPMRSLSELKMIRSLGYRQLQLLSHFVYIDDSVEQAQGQHKSRLHSELTATARLPFYERKGDSDGYLGYKYRHSLRYQLTYGSHVKAGLTGAQDAGEPFLGQHNRWGYDAYSYYLQLDRLGIVQRVIAGKYRLSAGMGLVMGNSFNLGKQAMLMSMGRTTATLRPHTSRSETDYFQGIAATVALTGHGSVSPPLTLTAFVSYRGADGTPSANGSISNLNYSGYHRTESEISRKYNTHLAATGGRIAFNRNGWRAAVNGIYTHLDRELLPPSTPLYRRYAAKGANFTNASIDYGYTRRRLSVSGETAICREGAVATANSITALPTENMSIMALWRFYSYRYTGLYSHTFGNSTNAQNENGLLLGTTWNPLRHLYIQAYADYAHHPWARYLVSRPSDDWEFMAQASTQWRQWSLTARGRVTLRQRDNEEKTALTANNTYRGRAALTFSPGKKLAAKTQIDVVRAFYLKSYKGWALSEQLTVKGLSWRLAAMAALFSTDDYYSRVYIRERQMAYEFYSQSFFGKGARLSLMGNATLLRQLTLTARLGYTTYFNRSVIGTGLQETNHSSLTDLDIQLRWKF